MSMEEFTIFAIIALIPISVVALVLNFITQRAAKQAEYAFLTLRDAVSQNLEEFKDGLGHELNDSINYFSGSIDGIVNMLQDDSMREKVAYGFFGKSRCADDESEDKLGPAIAWMFEKSENDMAHAFESLNVSMACEVVFKRKLMPVAVVLFSVPIVVMSIFMFMKNAIKTPVNMVVRMMGDAARYNIEHDFLRAQHS